MKNFTLEDVKRLTKTEDHCCISFYMPTNPASATTDEHRIRFKNLLHRAEKIIREQAPKDKHLSAMIGEGERLLANEYFWRSQSDGLAVFIAPGVFLYYRLPEHFEETFWASRRFYIKPLIPLFMADGRFYILALSQGEIRLFSCTRHNVMEIELVDVPGSIEEALQYDSKQSQLQFHTGTAGGGGPGGGNRPAIFHGQAVSIDDQKEEIKRYFQEVDHGLKNILVDHQAPLVLAGVDYLLPLFRKVSSHRNTLENSITGNPEGLKPEALHARALELVLPELERKQRETEQRYHEMSGKGYTAAGVRSVLPAAANGRVEALFVALDERRPGRFDREKNEVMVSADDDPADEDLLDLAAVESIRHGGVIYALNRDRLPEQHAAVAAVLRY